MSTVKIHRFGQPSSVAKVCPTHATMQHASLSSSPPESAVHGDIGEERERPITWAGVISFWLLAPVAVIGALRLRRLWRAVLLMPIVVVALTTVVFYGGHRIRSSAEPTIVIFAAIALDQVSRRRFRTSAPPTVEVGSYATDVVASNHTSP